MKAVRTKETARHAEHGRAAEKADGIDADYAHDDDDKGASGVEAVLHCGLRVVVWQRNDDRVALRTAESERLL